MSTKTYIVKRPHQGDRWYAKGDEREANPNRVAHLVSRGVLVEKARDAKDPQAGDTVSKGADDQAPAPDASDAGAKSEPAAKDKSEPAAKDKADQKAPPSKGGAE